MINCPNCGRPIIPEVLICDCGHSLISDIEAPEPIQADLRRKDSPSVKALLWSVRLLFFIIIIPLVVYMIYLMLFPFRMSAAFSHY